MIDFLWRMISMWMEINDRESYLRSIDRCFDSRLWPCRFDHRFRYISLLNSLRIVFPGPFFSFSSSFLLQRQYHHDLILRMVFDESIASKCSTVFVTPLGSEYCGSNSWLSRFAHEFHRSTSLAPRRGVVFRCGGYPASSRIGLW